MTSEELSVAIYASKADNNIERAIPIPTPTTAEAVAVAEAEAEAEAEAVAAAVAAVVIVAYLPDRSEQYPHDSPARCLFDELLSLFASNCHIKALMHGELDDFLDQAKWIVSTHND